MTKMMTDIYTVKSLIIAIRCTICLLRLVLLNLHDSLFCRGIHFRVKLVDITMSISQLHDSGVLYLGYLELCLSFLLSTVSNSLFIYLFISKFIRHASTFTISISKIYHFVSRKQLKGLSLVLAGS